MTNTTLWRIASRVFNRPLLILPSRAHLVADVLQNRLPNGIAWLGGQEIVPPVEAGMEANRFRGTRRRSRGSAMNANVNGTAVITIEGELVNRGAWIGTDSGLVSYEGLDAQLREAAADPEIHSILLDLDTPGGEAGGVDALGALIRAINKEKPVKAIVNDMAASGGYWLASQTSEIIVSTTSIVGSIGVVMLHLDRSQQLEDAGVKPTLIFRGAHKVDFNQFGPLSAEARAEIEKDMDTIYDLFLSAVSKGRGSKLGKAAARKTEAKIFTGKDAIAAGLADRIASLDEVLYGLETAAIGGGGGRGARAASSWRPPVEAVVEKPEESELEPASAEAAAIAPVPHIEGAAENDTPAIDSPAEAVVGSETVEEQGNQIMSEHAGKNASKVAVEIVTLCNAEGFPSRAASLIESCATLDEAKSKIAVWKEIKGAVSTARRACSQLDVSLTDQYIAAGTSIEGVRADLLARSQAVQDAAGPTRATHDAQHSQADVKAGWKRAVAKVNAQHAGEIAAKLTNA